MRKLLFALLLPGFLAAQGQWRTYPIDYACTTDDKNKAMCEFLRVELLLAHFSTKNPDTSAHLYLHGETFEAQEGDAKKHIPPAYRFKGFLSVLGDRTALEFDCAGDWDTDCADELLSKLPHPQ